jgi:hypothetical protein
MSKSARLAVLVATVGLLAAGCASIETTTRLNGQKLTTGDAAPVAHVYGSSWGLYVLSKFPIVTGDYDSLTGFAFFKDTVKPNYVVDLVTRKGKELNATRVVDLQSSWSSMWIGMILPILTYESAEASGNAVR